MATTPNALLAEVNAYQGQLDLLKLGLLRQLLLATNPMADTTPAALLQSAQCYLCQPPGMWPLFELALLKQLVDGGGVGGGILATTGDPEGVVTSPATPALAYDCATGALYAYCGTAGGNTGWQPLII